MLINGTLLASWDYTESVLWCIEDGEKLYIIKNGDHLKIYESDSEIWHADIVFEQFNEKIGGMIVNQMQKDINPKQWFSWFYNGNKALLIRKEF